MKTLTNMTNINLIAIFFFAIIILLSGCKKQAILSPELPESKIEDSPSASINKLYYHKTVDLMAGEHLYKVGTVEIIDLNDGTIRIRYSLDRPWKIHSTRLFVGALSVLPIGTDGECITDMFPYKQIMTAGGSITNSTILLQKNKLPKSGIIVANAKIINQETLSVPENAFAIGKKVSASSSAMYFDYNLNIVGRPVLSSVKNM